MELKTCTSCKKKRKIFRSGKKNGTPYKHCYTCTPRTPINKRSEKRAAEERLYTTIRKVFLSQEKNKLCGVNVVGCTFRATDIHHVKGRHGKRLLDKNYFLPSCRSCHTWIGNNPSEARAMGYIQTRSK